MAATDTRKILAWYVFAGALVTCVAVMTWFQLAHARRPGNVLAIVDSAPKRDPNAPLPKYKSVPDFQLVERSGRPVTRDDLKGKVWVADFIFTTCSGPCPLISKRMSDLQKRVAARDGVRLVSITVDPENDTPDVLKKYADRFGASADRWLFLTGEKSTVRALITNGFTLTAEDGTAPDSERVIHSTRLALVDKHGFIRGYYDGVGDLGIDDLVRDIERLLTE
jgi:protein SCO1